VASSATAAVSNVNDAPTGSVTIDDTTPAQGQTLTASNTLADPNGLGTIIYQWQRNGVDIVGATGATYTTSQADVGLTLRVVASYTDGQGTVESVTSASTAAVSNVNEAPTGSVTIDDTTPTQGQTLTASNTLADADGLGTITYQWQRNGVDIAGATGSTYTTSQADVGLTLRVVASYTDGQGTPESVASASTATVTNVNDEPTGGVRIVGTPEAGQTLNVDTRTLGDADGMGALSYQWLRESVPVPGANTPTYRLSSADAGREITVLVSWTDQQGSSETLSARTTVAAAPPAPALPPPAPPRAPLPEPLPPPPASPPAPAAAADPPAVTAPPAAAPATATPSAGSAPAAAPAASEAAPTLPREDTAAPGASGAFVEPTRLPAPALRPPPQIEVSADARAAAATPSPGATAADARLAATRALLANASPSFEPPPTLSPAAAEDASDQALRVPLQRGSNAEGEAEGRAPAEDGTVQGDTGTQASAIGAVPIVAGAGLAAGALWAGRAGGLLATLLIGAPAWRAIDPLPVVGGNGPAEDDEADSPADDDGADARGELLFDLPSPPSHEGRA
jgi:hypothetical protein